MNPLHSLRWENERPPGDPHTMPSIDHAIPRPTPAERPLHPAWFYVLLFSLGHFSVDFYAAMGTPLLAEFQKKFAIQQWEILAYTCPAVIFGSLLQPVLGLLADRANRGLLAGLAVLIAAIFQCLIGLSPHPLMLTVLLSLGGLGVGLFHPPSAATISRIVPGRSNLLMSLFVVSGMIGFATSGLLVTRLVQEEGTIQVFLERTWYLGPAGIAFAVVILAYAPFGPGVRADTAPERRDTVFSILRDFLSPDFRLVRMLWYIALLRGVLATCFQSFVPFVAQERGWTIRMAGGSLSAVLFSLGIGGLAGGYLSDRTDPRKVLFASTLLPIPFFMVFALWSSLASIGFLAAGGFLIGLATPLQVVLAQQYQPTRAGLVSGLMMGLAWGIAGLCTPLFGWIAQSIGNPWTLAGLTLILVPASFMVFGLPKGDTDRL